MHNFASLFLSKIIGVIKLKFNCSILQHPRTFMTDTTIHRLKFFNLIYSTYISFSHFASSLSHVIYPSPNSASTLLSVPYLISIPSKFLFSGEPSGFRSFSHDPLLRQHRNFYEKWFMLSLCYVLWRYMKDWSEKQLQVASTHFGQHGRYFSTRLDHGTPG